MSVHVLLMVPGPWVGATGEVSSIKLVSQVWLQRDAVKESDREAQLLSSPFQFDLYQSPLTTDMGFKAFVYSPFCWKTA